MAPKAEVGADPVHEQVQGRVEKKMEVTTVYWGYIGIMEKTMDPKQINPKPSPPNTLRVA